MRRSLLGTALACGTLLVAAVPATAAPATTTYHGTWYEAMDCGALEDSNTDSDVRAMSGKWRVILQPDGSSVVSIVVFDSKGVLHTAWGGRALMGLDFDTVRQGSGTFDVMQEGGRLTMALNPAGHLTFTINDLDCDRDERTTSDIMDAELYGTLSH